MIKLHSSPIRIGTHGSALVLRQTAEVSDLLRSAWPGLRVKVEIIRASGDEKSEMPLPHGRSNGAFSGSLEKALCDGHVDLAVHNLEDLPTDLPAGLLIGATPRRANPADVLISRKRYVLDSLPTGAKIGTCSPHRAAQLRNQRPDLHIIEIHGSIDTRIQQAFASNSPYDGIVMAYAGLQRLDRLDVMSEKFPLEVMMPAPGQGALAVQCRDEARWRLLLKPINNPETEAAVTAERAFLSGMGAGHTLPVAAVGSVRGETLRLMGRVSALDGSRQIDTSGVYLLPNLDIAAARRAGEDLAHRIKEQGAEKLLQAGV